MAYKDQSAGRTFENALQSFQKAAGVESSPKNLDVNQWFQSAYDIIKEMNSYNDERWDVYDPNYGGKTASRLDQILGQAISVGDELRRQNRPDYSEWNTTLLEYRRVLSGLDQQNKQRQQYFSQFENADAYSP